MEKVILIISVAVLCTMNVVAQTTPTPPEPPQTQKSTTYSVSTFGDDDFSDTSVSIKKTDATYKLRASFDRNRTKGVRDLLMDRLGKNDVVVNGSTYTWSRKKSGERVFECKLSKGLLRMTIDKGFVSNVMYEELETIGLELKDYISGTDHKEQAKKDLERAERDLERAKRDLDRAKRDIARRKKGD